LPHSFSDDVFAALSDFLERDLAFLLFVSCSCAFSRDFSFERAFLGLAAFSSVSLLNLLIFRRYAPPWWLLILGRSAPVQFPDGSDV